MVSGLLGKSNANPIENTDTWIPHLVWQLNGSTVAQVRMHIDDGFTGNDTLENLAGGNF